MLSISTSWNHKPDLDLRQWLGQIKELGLSSIELSYTLTQHQLDEILSSLDKLGISVSSIHNFCPLPDVKDSKRHPSNAYRLSALDETERQQAVLHTNKTIDLARRVHAAVVVIHAGTIEIEPNPSTPLLNLFKEGKRQTPEFEKVKQDLIKIRDEKKGPYLEALKSSLQEVVEYAKKNQVKIGLETRYYPTEIPNFEEVQYFLDLFDPQAIGYWHDVGHAEVNDRLGLAQHLEFLKKYQKQLLGAHIHGMNVLRDHLAPFEGDMDLTKILPYIGKNVIRVIESRYATVEEIKSAIQKLA